MASSSQVPSEPPPSYQAATSTGSSSASRPRTTSQLSSSHLSAHDATSQSIPAAARRSMEDELRPLPKGWVRSFDPESHHQFFVDTSKDPPRSIWVHPYDDEEYLRTLSSEEREHIEQESMNHGRSPSKADIMSAHTDDEDDTLPSPTAGPSRQAGAELPPRPEGKGKSSFGRKFKDKVTGSTHEERQAKRRQRAEEERQMYQQHQRMREAMSRAMQTGQPQLVGKDKQGRDVYVEPPAMQPGYGGYGGGYGYNPYMGPYSGSRYMRPPMPYGRPYGRGFGGGYGMPLALGGGLLGGMLLGDMMF